MRAGESSVSIIVLIADHAVLRIGSNQVVIGVRLAAHNATRTLQVYRSSCRKLITIYNYSS
jgi:hypothetical protein